MREGSQFFSTDFTMYQTKYKLLPLNTSLRTNTCRELLFYRNNMTLSSIIYRILRYPINPNRRVPEACVCPRRPSDIRTIFEGCLERFAWFAPKTEGCLKQNAFRETLFFQKRGMSRAKSLFYKSVKGGPRAARDCPSPRAPHPHYIYIYFPIGDVHRVTLRVYTRFPSSADPPAC